LVDIKALETQHLGSLRQAQQKLRKKERVQVHVAVAVNDKSRSTPRLGLVGGLRGHVADPSMRSQTCPSFRQGVFEESRIGATVGLTQAGCVKRRGRGPAYFVGFVSSSVRAGWRWGDALGLSARRWPAAWTQQGGWAIRPRRPLRTGAACARARRGLPVGLTESPEAGVVAAVAALV
jgi:hypothetical protein